MAYALDFRRDGASWPNRSASRFVSAGGTTFHVQDMGEGPLILLVHGTGAATHSWRGLMPLLAEGGRVVAMDLPGHGFTPSLPGGRLTIEAMAGSLAALLETLAVTPQVVVGHSAGAVILARMALDRRIAPRALVSLNGAFMPLGGFLGHLFSPIAKLLVLNPFTPSMMSRHFRDEETLRRLMRDTGSRLDDEGLRLYRLLAQAPSHIAGALDMMASWNLPGFICDLPGLPVPLVLVTGLNDRTIPPGDAERVKALLPSARLLRLPGLGHLAHEEAPDKVMPAILAELPQPAGAG